MSGRRRVAVTGIGVVSPVGTGVGAFWSSLLAGRSGIGPISSFDASALRARIAGEVLDFDAEEWVDTKDVKRLDRFCHFALAASAQAADDAGFTPASPERVATTFTSGFGGARTMEEAAMTGVRTGSFSRMSPYFVPAVIANMAAGQIALRMGYGGPSACPVSACASSSDAIGWGFRLVRDGYADACLAGGAEACVTGSVIAGFGNMRALSTRNDEPERASRPFDGGRDGFVMGEGAAALMLEPLDDAVARGATIYCELRGYGQSTDAHHQTAPDPDGAGAARAIQAALDDAEAAPESVTYVNAHGTSTPLQDRVETAALRRVFGDHAGELAVSSTKSMTGHLLGGAGAIEAAACSLAIDRGWVPPTINHEDPDPDCDLDCVPNEARRLDVDVAISTSMGFGGHNACLVMGRA